MSEEQPQKPAPQANDMDREIVEHRKFSLAEAIGRLAGGDLMKGASPVTFKRQAELLIEQYLESHLVDPEGALEVVLLRSFSHSDNLLEHGYADPLAALTHYVQELLDSEQLLRGFVTEVDAHWGRTYGERPFFEKLGQPAHPDDPYTLASVHNRLSRLQQELFNRAGSGE